MICWNCGVDVALKRGNPEEYKRRMIANAKASDRKMRERGTKRGMKVNWTKEQIIELRQKGYTIRAIKKELGCSLWSVCIHIKKAREDGLL